MTYLAGIDDLRLYSGDLIPPYCPWGLRAWWKLHELDFADFLKNGILAKDLLATGDSAAHEAVMTKWERLHGQ